MKTPTRYTRIVTLLTLLVLSGGPVLAAPLGTAFTYQGKLVEGGNPANGSYDLKFTLYDALSSGSVVAGPLTNAATGVTNGLFTVALDFGTGVFDGNVRWLEIGVRTNGSGAFSPLNPRQALTPAPYALYTPNAGAAASVSGSVAASQITGTLPDTQLPASVARTNQVWLLGGNSGTTPGTQFLGTTDNQPLELKVNAQRVLRIEPLFSPNLIGGQQENRAGSGVYGATIAGGGKPSEPNVVEGSMASIVGGTRQYVAGPGSFVGGGYANQIASNSFDSVVTGGFSNQIGSASSDSVISGGFNNMIWSVADFATIGGGKFNVATNREATVAGGAYNQARGFSSTVGGGGGNINQSDWAVITAGRDNRIDVDSPYSTIGGGINNIVWSVADVATIGGGRFNMVSNHEATVSGGGYNQALGFSSTVGGGDGNINQSDWAVIAAGGGNRIDAYSPYSTIGGGVNNIVWSLADATTIGGGRFNVVSNQEATVSGGGYNQALGFSTTVGGGGGNINQSDWAVIAAGGGNRIEAQSPYSTIGGGINNHITALSFGATIAGGTDHYMAGPRGFVGGGYSHRIASNSFDSVITCGFSNQIGSASSDSVIAGGANNIVWSVADVATIGGGRFNVVSNHEATVSGGGYNQAIGFSSTVGGGGGNINQSDWAVIAAGRGNRIDAQSPYSTIAGGAWNIVGTNSSFSAVGGGTDNNIAANAAYGTLAGGRSNQIGTNAAYSAIGGGYSNNIAANASYATIPGGYQNAATNYAFAAGRRAKANHTGSFVWADSTDADFASTTSNQFNIRATGGVGIGTADPAATLDVYGPQNIGTSSDGIVNIGNSSGFHVTLDSNELHARSGSGTSTLYLNDFGGNINVGRQLYVVYGSGVGVGTSSLAGYKFYVNGTAYSTGGWSGSDARWKCNIRPITEALKKVMHLQGVTYDWRRDEFPDKNFDASPELGFLAQEVERVIPEAVRTDADGYKAIAYEKLTAVLTEGVKQQQHEIDSLKTQNARLERAVVELKALVEMLSKKVNGGGQ